MQYLCITVWEINMQTLLKSDQFRNNDELAVHHDAHIKAYEAEQLGIRVVLCDSRGIPVSDSLAPMASYLPYTSYNM